MAEPTNNTPSNATPTGMISGSSAARQEAERSRNDARKADRGANNTPSNSTPTGMIGGSSAARQEAERSRNDARNEAKSLEAQKAARAGKVYDLALQYVHAYNEESIASGTNVTFGNDEFTLASSSTANGNTSSGVGDKLVGIEIIWADETEEFISLAEILQGYDYDEYWSVVFAVSGNTFTKAVSYDATEALFDYTGSNQTAYRLRIKTLGVDIPQTSVNISALGQYREVILCINGDPVTTLIKTS